MQRLPIVAVVLAVLFAAMTFASLRVVPPWAMRLMEEGRELSLPMQVVIASSNFWARWWVILAVPLVIALAFVASRRRRSPRS